MAEIRSLCVALLRGNVTLLSGAGLSTESGLRDYRSPGRELRRTPMTATEFMGSAESRKRYWARSFAGYDALATATPNRAHIALAALHGAHGDQFRAHVTQNVDGLLQRAGAVPSTLVELHGGLSHAVCDECGALEPRSRLQGRMAALNDLAPAAFRPDGDAEVAPDAVARFILPRCSQCRSYSLSPGVVFNGGSVPREVTAAARRAVDDADVLWVIGSTCTTYSSFSLVRRAKANGASVVGVSFGPTRADDLFDFKLETLIGDTVERAVRVIHEECRSTATKLVF